MRRQLSVVCLAVVALTLAAAPGVHAESICGLDAADAKALSAKVDALALPKAPAPETYVAYQDAANRISWTLTAPAHAAHPAAVCRQVVQQGDSIKIDMRVLCDGPQEACDQLVGDFQMMADQMRRNVQPRY